MNGTSNTLQTQNCLLFFLVQRETKSPSRDYDDQVFGCKSCHVSGQSISWILLDSSHPTRRRGCWIKDTHSRACPKYTHNEKMAHQPNPNPRERLRLFHEKALWNFSIAQKRLSLEIEYLKHFGMISNVSYAQEFNATFHGMFKSLHLDKVQEWKWEKISEEMLRVCSILSCVVLQDPYHCRLFWPQNPMLWCQLAIVAKAKGSHDFYQIFELVLTTREINWVEKRILFTYWVIRNWICLEDYHEYLHSSWE